MPDPVLGGVAVDVNANLEPLQKGFASAKALGEQFAGSLSQGLAKASTATDKTTEAQNKLNQSLQQSNIVYVQFNRALNDNQAAMARSNTEMAGSTTAAGDHEKAIHRIVLATKLAVEGALVLSGAFRRFLVTEGLSTVQAAAGATAKGLGMVGAGLAGVQASAAGAATSLKTAAGGATAASTAAAGFATTAALGATAAKGFQQSLSTVATSATVAGGVVKTLQVGVLGFQAVLLNLRSVLGIVGVAFLAFEVAQHAVAAAKERMDEITETIKKARDAGLSFTFFQTQIKAAEDFKTSAEAATTAMINFKKATTPQLGGSEFDKRLKELQDAGNFKGNTGIAEYKSATSIQEKYKAVVDIIDQAIKKRERLAALDLAGKFLPPEMLEQLRASDSYLADIQKKAQDIGAEDIISPEEAVRAQAIKDQLAAAYAILSEKWKPFESEFRSLGYQIDEVWAGIIGRVATLVDWVGKLLDKLGEIANLVPSIPWDRIGAGLKQVAIGAIPVIGPGLVAAKNLIPDASAPAASGSLADQAGYNSIKKTTAVLKEQALQIDENSAKWKKLGDISKETGNDTENAWTRAVTQANKAIAVQQAEANAVGLGAGALEKFRLQAQLTEAAKKEGITISGQYAKTFDEIGAKAEAAGTQLALARLKDQTALERQLIGLDQYSEKVAQDLHKIYGKDYTKEMDSFLAGQIKLNEYLKEAKSISVDFMSGFIKDIRSGTTALASLTNALNKVADKLIDMALNKSISGLFGALGTSGLGNFFGTPGIVGIPTHAHGGLVGAGGPTMSVHPSVFAGAPHFQGGGIVGLDPNAIPIIAHKNEEILTPYDPRHRNNAGAQPQVNNNFNVVNHSDAQVSSMNSQPNQQGGLDFELVLDRGISAIMSKPGSAINKGLREGFGVQQSVIRR